MIPTIDKEIIEKLKQGLSPAQISIEYGAQNKEVTASYVRHIKMLVDADMTDLLEEESDIDVNERITGTATTSRQYQQMRMK